MKKAVQEVDKDTRDNNVSELSDKIIVAVTEKYGEEYAEENAQSIGDAIYKLEKNV